MRYWRGRALIVDISHLTWQRARNPLEYPMRRFEFPEKYDGLSKFGATLLAECVMDYWVRRGVGNVFAERFAIPGTASWGVRSNLVAGLPPARVRRPARA
jgi:hypothetical protein